MFDESLPSAQNVTKPWRLSTPERHPELLAPSEDCWLVLSREAFGMRRACSRCRTPRVIESGSKLHALHALRAVRVLSGIIAGTGGCERVPTMHKTVPSARDKAPTSTWAVAMSAALFDQMVAAPKSACATTRAIQPSASRLSGCSLPSLLRAAQAQPATPPRISSATIR